MTFSTPSVSHLTAEDFELVYEPAEDSFLMMDALEKDAQLLHEIRATDINAKAALCTTRTAKQNGCTVSAVVTDLLSSMYSRLKGKIDVLLFNPPYVATPTDEVASEGIQASWAGGINGRQVTDRLLPVVSSLLSPKGCFYLVAVAENKPDDIICFLEKYGLHGETVLQRKAGCERLSILRFSHKNL
ncbi:methyltransferase N6AMT1 isoform X2 [Nematostella vectensis]|uniref:methyltransferase N6AMT1 isoform X2 n=1 Tax=Nematostella vectensis TaxID=45351 RepID=UPI00138FF045|nr:methyltransferase N6AMT1 isoform X2 [Nematostella vectensis]